MYRATSAPTTREIFGVGDPLSRVNLGIGMPPARNMGIDGPPSHMSWDEAVTSGYAAAAQGMAEALNYGQSTPGEVIGSITLKTMDFIQYSYSVRPLQSGLRIMPEMLVFTVNEQLDEDFGSVAMLTLGEVNKLANDQWNDFVIHTSGDVMTNPHWDIDAVEFLASLRHYGENGLESYAYARNHKDSAKVLEQMEGYESGLENVLSYKAFWERSTMPGFCYLTRYGFWRRLSFAGVVININRAEMMESENNFDSMENYPQVNVGIGKRLRTANVFAENCDMKVGAKAYILLTRKRCGTNGSKFGAFVLRPYGTREHPHPPHGLKSYVDESGGLCQGFHWVVGTVIEPPSGDNPMFNIEQATNATDYPSLQRAYDAHATLSILYLAVGYGH